MTVPFFIWMKKINWAPTDKIPGLEIRNWITRSFWAKLYLVISNYTKSFVKKLSIKNSNKITNAMWKIPKRFTWTKSGLFSIRLIMLPNSVKSIVFAYKNLLLLRYSSAKALRKAIFFSVQMMIVEVNWSLAYDYC